MDEKRTKKPWVMSIVGLAIGLLFGLGIMIGALVATSWVGSVRLEFPETALHATATHGGDTMAMATGPIDQGIEGLFVLDFLTGDLQCTVLNPNSGQLGGLYRANVVKDLGVVQNKNPKYLMVTGAANFRVTGGSVRPAQTVVYVADANTGRFVGYWLPWNRNAASYNFAQAYEMIRLGVGTTRRIEVE
jgi:hypothetical protein